MSSGVGNKGEQLMAAFDGPRQGISRNVAFHEIAPDALYDSLNVLWREGSLQARPGNTLFASTDLSTRPTGAYNTTSLASGAFQADSFQADAFQEAANVPNTTLVVGTNTKIWAYFGGVFNDITDTALTAIDSQLARFTSIYLGTTLNILMTNGVDNPRVWDSTSATVSVVTGTPPLFNDWCTAGDHVVGIVYPFTVRWGANLSISSWPAANVKVLSDTADAVVAIRNLGTLGFVVWKQRSIWIGTAQGGIDAAFFAFNFFGWYEGPAGPAAIADADGIQYWITNTGRLGAFDGVRQQWVGEGLYPVIRADVDQANMGRAFAVYEPLFREVWFFYPRSGASGDLKGCVVVTLPRPEEGITRHGAYLGRLERFVSAGVDLRIDTNKAMIFGSTASDRKAYTLEGTTDAGTDFTGYFQTGVQEVPGRGVAHLGGIEVLAERGTSYGSLTVKALTSNMLDVAGGTQSTGVTLSLTTTPYHADIAPSQQSARFFGLRCDFTTPITLRYRGARMYRMAESPQAAAIGANVGRTS